jgi:quercetin dioxygenase-like cupin family protein
MSDPSVIFEDLVSEAAIPKRGIHSQTISDEDGVELILFAFADGERLSEHTSARPAIMHFLAGQAEVTVGERALTANPGTWIRMAAGTSHSIVAVGGVVMALYLLPRPEAPSA